MEQIQQGMSGRDRLIVALDVPTPDEALRLVDQLDNVSIFKVGWQLYITGHVATLLQRLMAKRVFIDLKVPGDIGNTIGSVVEMCVQSHVMFLTLSESMPLATIRAARTARGQSYDPKLLTVPLLSSLDEEDLREMLDGEVNRDEFILRRARLAIGAGCDGLIASGDAIKLCRDAFGSDVVIVSPGIRPAGYGTDDHKRHTTPTQAIALGADYLVVGRPILNDQSPRDAAQRIIDEIDDALDTNVRGEATPHQSSAVVQ
jgi:orotidine-5'-phosphate decarboxylase